MFVDQSSYPTLFVREHASFSINDAADVCRATYFPNELLCVFAPSSREFRTFSRRFDSYRTFVVSLLVPGSFVRICQ